MATAMDADDLSILNDHPLAIPTPPALPQPPPTGPPQPPPTPSCVICYDKDVELIRACRVCPEAYCRECLFDVFESSITTASRFPPRCCSHFQLYTVLPEFPDDKAKQYRLKFEEWLSEKKVYCPVKTCSSFISERYIPQAKSTGPPKMSLHEKLSSLLQQLNLSPHARFFRGDMNITSLPRFNEIVANHIHLGDIQRKIESGLYTSISDLANDVVLITNNAKLYNGDQHPVTKAAQELFAFFIDTLSKHSEYQVEDATPQPDDLFPCPACHVAICTACMEVEHRGVQCDKSRESEEMAMLEQFGYKKCPRCSTGVRKMYGCSHIQCHCGAHWCWSCARSIDECIGDCGRADDEGGEDDDDDDVVDEDEELSDAEDDENEENEDSGSIEESRRPTNPSAGNVASTTADQNMTVPQAAQATPLVPQNLDAGPYHRWADGEYDFGEEPDDEPLAQVWSCKHSWVPFVAPQDGCNHGDLDFLECNRCFRSLKPSRGKSLPARWRSKGEVMSKEKDEAWDCQYCRLIVCIDCKGKYQASRKR